MRRPVIMHRARGLSGPFFQQLGQSLVKGVGNFVGLGGGEPPGPPDIVINNAGAVEGSPIAFTVSLNRPGEDDVVLDLGTRDGTAVGGVNYEVDNFEVSYNNGNTWEPAGGVAGTELTLATGRTRALVRLDTVADPTYTGNLTFTFEVASVISGTVGSSDDTGTGTIIDAQSAPVVTIGDAAAIEGSPLDFALSLSSPSFEAITLDLATTDGTAVGGVNFETSGFEVSTDGGTIWNPAGGASQTEVTFAAGESSLLVRVDSIAIPTYTGDLDFTLGVDSVVSGTTGAVTDTGTGTLQDAQAPPDVTIGDAAGIEGTPLDFTVSFSIASAQNTILEMQASGGTAVAGEDYDDGNFQVSTDGGNNWSPAGGSGARRVTFTPGTTSLLVRVTTIDNDVVDGDRTFLLSVGSVVSGTVGSTADTGTGTIQDEDVPATEQLFQGSAGNSSMASASSQWAAGYEPALAFDGFFDGVAADNRWINSEEAGQEINPNGQCWFQFDFGAPKLITQIRFAPRGSSGAVSNFPSTIRILTGSDPTFATFDEENTITDIQYTAEQWGDWLAVINQASARYLRIEFHTVTYNGGSGALYEVVAIQEIEFYELV